MVRDYTNPYQKYIIAGETVTVGGIISNVKKIITKKGQPMMFVKLQDLTDKIEVVVFPRTLENCSELLQENKIVSITGRADYRDNAPKIIAESIEEILEA